MLNTYGLKMSGLRKVAGETKSLSGPYSPEYLQLNYDRSTGEVWTDFFSSMLSRPPTLSGITFRNQKSPSPFDPASRVRSTPWLVRQKRSPVWPPVPPHALAKTRGQFWNGLCAQERKLL